MTDQVFWQDGDSASPENLSQLRAQTNSSDYVERGVTFTPDYANNELDIATGHAVIYDSANDRAYDVFPDARTNLALTDTATNYVYLMCDPDNVTGSGVDDDVGYHIDTDDTPPTATETSSTTISLKVGEVDTTAAATSTEVNREPAVTAQSVQAENELNGPQLTIGVLGDIHWASDATGNRFTSQSDLKSRLDTFIDDMNAQAVDVVIQIGDLADGVNGPGDQKTNSEIVTNVTDARDYLETTGGSAGSGLDCPVEYVMGNHEQVHGDSMTELNAVYDAFGYSGIEDTFRIVTYKGIDLAILNTSFTTTDYNTDANDHKIPDSTDPYDGLQWLRDNVQPAERPVYTFMHNPVSFPRGANYQNTTNQVTAAKILADAPAQTMGVFGHVHNAGPFWKLIQQDDDYFGSQYLHTGYIYDLVGDTSVTPYGTLQAFDHTGLWQFDTSYDKETVGYQSTWRGNGGEFREHSAARQRFEQMDWETDFEETWVYPDDQPALASTVSGTNSKLTETDDRTVLQTDASVGASAQATNAYKYPPFDREWYGTRAFRTQVNFDATSGVTGNVVCGDRTGRHFGFEIVDNTIYGSVGDGTNTNRTSIQTYGGTVRLGAQLVPGKFVEFYVADENLVTSTSLPFPAADGSGANANKLMQLYVESTDGTQQLLSIGYWQFYQSHRRDRIRMVR